MDERQQPDVARGLQQGKTEAWQSLYEAYARPLWGWIARLMGGDSADVADVVQETFLAAARSAPKYDPARGSLWLWLCGIGRNHVALHYRKQKRHDRLDDCGDGAADGQRVFCRRENGPAPPEEALAAEELAVSVRAVLTELSTECFRPGRVDRVVHRIRDPIDRQILRWSHRGRNRPAATVFLRSGPLEAGPCPSGLSPGLRKKQDAFARYPIRCPS